MSESDNQPGLPPRPEGTPDPPANPWARPAGEQAPATTTPAEQAPTAPAAPPPPPPARTPLPTPAAATPDAPRRFGDHMAVGVLLTLAAGSAAAGGILALQQLDADTLSFMWRAVVCAGVAAVLLAAAVVLRLVRGSAEVRGVLAFLGIAYATACLAFAYDPVGAGDHDNVVKFAVGAGVVAVLGWFTAVAVPSAVAALLGAVAVPAAVGSGVWLAIDSPTHVEVYVAAMGAALALAVALPNVPVMRPHPLGLGWALSGAAIAITLPAIELVLRGDATGMAAGGSAGLALLLLAQRHGNLPAAVGALACLGALETVLVTRFVGESTSNGVQGTRLIAVAAVGLALILLVGAGVLYATRGRRVLPARVDGVAAEAVLVVALALAVLSLFTGPGDVPFNPPQLSSGSTATHLPAAGVALRA